MKITEVEFRWEPIALARPYEISYRRIDAVEIGVVILRDGAGHVGLGAASPSPHVTGESLSSCRAALADASLGWLRGADVRTLPALARRLHAALPDAPAARAAVDMAMHDLLAQGLGLPLVDVLGRAHDGLPTSITIGIKATGEAMREADEYVARGFEVLKVKLGRDVDQDLDHLRQLRAHVGPAIRLRVDPNQGYGLSETQRFFTQARDLDVEFVEQPVPVGATDELRSLDAELRTRIAIDEALVTPADALRWAATPAAAGIFNIKLMKCGGISAALRIAAIAEEARLSLMWGCMDESRISIAAALHAALASPATRYLDLDGSLDLARDVADGGFQLERGVLRPAPGAGLGLRLLP